MKIKVLVITHCYPKDERDNAGVWIKQLWGDQDSSVFDATVLHIPKIPRNIFKWLKEIKKINPDVIVAYWVMPAGVLAFLSGRKYILNIVGTDLYKLAGNRLLRVLLTPVIENADRLVFIGTAPKKMFDDMFGERQNETLIYLPMNTEMK